MVQRISKKLRNSVKLLYLAARNSGYVEYFEGRTYFYKKDGSFDFYIKSSQEEYTAIWTIFSKVREQMTRKNAK